MKLSPFCQKAYERWISVDTWHTGHPQDRKRFYGFVTAFLQYSQKGIEEENLKRDIISRYEDRLEATYLGENAQYYEDLFHEIVEFIKVTKR